MKATPEQTDRLFQAGKAGLFLPARTAAGLPGSLPASHVFLPLKKGAVSPAGTMAPGDSSLLFPSINVGR